MVVWHPNDTDTVNAVFDRAVLEHADDVFLDFGGTSFTYAQTSHRAARTANLLLSLGVKHGDTVVTLLDNNIDAVTSFLGINRIGAICVPVNTAYRGEFLRHQISDAAAAAVIAESDYAARVMDVADGVAELSVVLHREAPTATVASLTRRPGLTVRSLEEALASRCSGTRPSRSACSPSWESTRARRLHR